MKNLDFLKYAAILLIFAAATAGCGTRTGINGDEETQFAEVNNGEDGQPTSLEGTKWKLVGIMDLKTGELIEFEPKDCEECYTITFNYTSTSFWGKVVEVECFSSCYTIDYTLLTIQFPLGIQRPDAEDIYDGEVFLEILIHKFQELGQFELKNTELKLYYNDKNNYLLFKNR